MGFIRVGFLRVGFLILLVFLTCDTARSQWAQQSSGTTADFRGLSAVSSLVAWASGTRGTFARTTDGGATWRAETVKGAEALDFRDIDAFDDKTAYVLSIGKGELSRIYKTVDGGASWMLQFTNSKAEAFFDAMAFWDRDHGIAFSDPVGGRFIVITTVDGGASWEEVASDNIPPAISGEGGFAASGTCIAVQGKTNAWFATGGAASRVFRSTDMGRTWTVSQTPINKSGVESAGIFSIAFKDARNGIIVGGDYKEPDSSTQGVAATTDGGQTWRLITRKYPAGYRSAVAYLRVASRQALIAVGTSGSDYSVDGGIIWLKLDGENYNSVSFARQTEAGLATGSKLPSGAGWAAGPAGRIAKFTGKLPKRIVFLERVIRPAPRQNKRRGLT